MRIGQHIVPLFAALVILVLVVQKTQLVSDEHSAMFLEVVDRYKEQGHRLVNEYAAVVEARLNESLSEMFDDLDKNADGCIDRSEFKSKSLSLLATLRSLDLPDAPSVGMPPLPHFVQPLSLATRVVGLQFLFLMALFIIEHLRVLVLDPLPHLSTGEVNWNVKAPQVSKDRALWYDTPNTLYEKLKFVFFVVTGLLFMRIVLTLLFFAVAVGFVNLSTLGGRTRNANPWWFKVCATGCKVFGYLMLAAMGFYCIRVYGKRATRQETKLLIGNHICMIEVVILYLLANLPSFVSRVENLSIPLFRGIVAASDAVVVDRDAAASRAKTLDAIKKRASDDNATQLLIFPEGTCGNQLALFQFKKGAFEPGVPVQLVCFYYPYTHFNPAWTGRACNGNDAFDLFLRLWSQFVNRVEVRFLPVYTPTAEEAANPLLYAEHCQRVMAGVIGNGVSSATFADYVEAYKRFHKKVVVNADSNVTTPRRSPTQVEKKTA